MEHYTIGDPRDPDYLEKSSIWWENHVAGIEKLIRRAETCRNEYKGDGEGREQWWDDHIKSLQDMITDARRERVLLRPREHV